MDRIGRQIRGGAVTDKPDPKPSTLHIQTTSTNKARWVQTAQREGKKLAQWVEETLNKASRFDDE